MLTPNQIPCEVFFKKHLKSSQQTPKVQVISPILQMGPLRLKVVKQLAQSHRANWRGGGAGIQTQICLSIKISLIYQAGCWND